jgi:hypothetical protein
MMGEAQRVATKHAPHLLGEIASGYYPGANEGGNNMSVQEIL